MEETRLPLSAGCPTGDAVATAAGKLRDRYVFHAVGPVWHGGMQQESKLLASVYRRCLELAVEHECRSIAFPAISTGVYSYPADLAADCSLKTVRDFLLDRALPARSPLRPLRRRHLRSLSPRAGRYGRLKGAGGEGVLHPTRADFDPSAFILPI